MKIKPLRKMANYATYARVIVHHGVGRTQVEIAQTERDLRDCRHDYENAPKAFIGADVRYIDGRWCWVLDDESETVTTTMKET